MTCYDATLRVPQSSLQDYQSAEFWREFSNIISVGGPEVGDLDGDGNVGITDITLLIDYILNGGDINPQCADVDQNGVINITDITALIDYVLNHE